MTELQAVGIECFALDVTSQSTIDSAHLKIFELTGGTLDVLLNSAGRQHYYPVVEVDMESTHALFDTNVYGPMRMVTTFFPLLSQSKGVIVNIASTAGVALPFVWAGVYSATKSALLGYGDVLRVEVKPFGIRVMTVVAGVVQSNMSQDRGVISSDSLWKEPFEASMNNFNNLSSTPFPKCRHSVY